MRAPATFLAVLLGVVMAAAPAVPLPQGPVKKKAPASRTRQDTRLPFKSASFAAPDGKIERPKTSDGAAPAVSAPERASTREADPTRPPQPPPPPARHRADLRAGFLSTPPPAA